MRGKMKEKIFLSGIVSAVIFLIGALILVGSSANVANAQQATATQKNVVRDSATILLEGKIIPTKDYIHLYDSTPYLITSGHIAAKLPCDANSVSPLKILIGQAPNLTPATLELVKPLSTPGKQCIYHVDIPSKGQIVTDVAIQNPTANEIKFPPTSTIVIGVNEISPLPASSSQGGM
jgi:hypothetical protein